MTQEVLAPPPDDDSLPELPLGLSTVLILALALIPLAWVLRHGPDGTYPAQVLAQEYQAGTAANRAAAGLMHVATTYKAAAWALILAQGSVMSVLIMSVSARAESLFPGRRAGLWAAGFMAGSLEWLRWSALVAPDSLANSLGALGLMAMMTREVNQPRLRIFWIFCGLTCLAVAGLLAHFWWILLAGLAAWLLAGRLPGRWRIAVTLFLTTGCIYFVMPGLVAGLVAQTPQREVLPGQVLGGYPDFQVSAPASPGRVVAGYQRVKVALVRAGLELAQIRSVYSWKHNLAILLLSWPIIGLSLLGFISYGAQSAIVMLWITAGLWAVMVGCSYADWDGRFFPAIWPVVALVASGTAGVVVARRWFWKSLACIVLIATVAVVCRYPILEGVGRWLVVDDGQPGELIVVLVGGDPDRDRLALELYGRGRAREIWFANDRNLPESDPANDAGKMAYRFQQQGVARDRIKLLPSARNTTQEAQRVAERLATLSPAERPRSVNVVTTAFHTRRASMIFRKYLSPLGVKVYMAASTDESLPVHEWWMHPRTRSIFTQELAKILFSWLGLG